MPDLLPLNIRDRESADAELEVRPQHVVSSRLVLAIGKGDDATGTSLAVALDPADVDLLEAYLGAWKRTRRG